MLNFAIIGPQKCGTSWIDFALRRINPSILPTNLKETFYLDQEFHRGSEWHRALYPSDAKLIGEVSPTYFASDLARIRLMETNPDARIVAILRSPLERMASDMMHVARHGVVQFDGEETRIPPHVWAGARDSSSFAAHGQDWLEAFGDAILFVDFDDIRTSPVALISRIWGHIGMTDPIDEAMIQSLRDERVYDAAVPRNRVIAKGAYVTCLTLQHLGAIRVVNWLRKSPLRRLVERRGGSELKDFRAYLEREIDRREDFQADIAFAESVIGRSLPHWRPGHGADEPATPDACGQSPFLEPLPV